MTWGLQICLTKNEYKFTPVMHTVVAQVTTIEQMKGQSEKLKRK